MTPPDMQGEATSTGTVDRVALLLRVLAESEEESSVAQIAERMKLPASTTHRLLGLLVNSALAERGGRPGTYRVGVEFLRLGGLVVSRTDVTRVADGFMQHVASATGETCVLNLYVPAGHKGMIAKVVHGNNPLRYEAELYKVAPLSFGATGRGVLAFLPDDAIRQVLAMRDTSPVTGRPVGDTPAVRRDLAEIRSMGYAITHGQRTPGAVGIAAPVFKAGAAVVGALCITMPETRFAASRQDKFAKVVVEQAAELSALLGHATAPR